MPAVQRGQVDRIKPGHWRLRYYLPDGARKSKQPFPSKSAAWTWYRENVEPQVNGGVAPLPALTLAEFVPIYLERHAATVRPRTIKVLKERLPYACYRIDWEGRRSRSWCLSRADAEERVEQVAAHERKASPTMTPTPGKIVSVFGDIPLRELERMSGEIAAWQAGLSDRSRYGYVQALRQALGAAVRWGHMSKNPAKLAGKNRQPAPRGVRAYSRDELTAIATELSPRYQSLPEFAAATGLRPEEWQALERRDVDRRAGVLNVLRTVSDGVVVELAKNNRSRRQVPMSKRALAALDALPPRLDTPLLFPAPQGGLMNLDHFRAREWRPAIIASGVHEPARIYDLRATFASTAIRAGVPIFELAKIMGTSVRMIELHYGSLLDGAAAAIASRLDAYDNEQDETIEPSERFYD